MQTRPNNLLDKLCLWILARRGRNGVTETHQDLRSSPRGVEEIHATARKGTPYMDMGRTAVIDKFTAVKGA
jgi:hypothetical protein